MNILFICTATGKKSFVDIKSSRQGAIHTDSKIIPFIESQYKSLVNLGVSIDLFTIKSSGLKGYINGYSELRKKLNSKKYDILHAHFVFSGLLSLICKPRSSKLVISFLGGDLWGTYNSKNQQTVIGFCTKILSKVLSSFSDSIIVKSAFLEKFIPSSNKVKTSIIPNGVDFEVFKPLDMEKCKSFLNLDNTKKYILFMSDTRDPRKGFGLLEKAFKFLDPNQYEILAPYPQEHKKLNYYYSASSALVSTSRLEGSQNVIKEALACNLPVVSTDSGDSKERLKDLKGSYITTGTPDDLSSKIILASRKKYNYRSKISEITLDNIAKKLVDVYSKTL